MKTIVSDLTHREAATLIWNEIVPHLHVPQEIAVLATPEHYQGCIEDLTATMSRRSQRDTINKYSAVQADGIFRVNASPVIYVRRDINQLRGFTAAWVWLPDGIPDDVWLITDREHARFILSHD